MDDQDGAATLAIADAVATITLNRPERLNAFDTALHAAVRNALDRVEAAQDVGALILTGAGRAFSAGQDLAERTAQFAMGHAPDLHASLEENYNPLVRRIAALPFPVIAAVNGMAAGAGAAIAIGCDIVLAAESARFQFAFAKVALGPDSGTSWLLPRLVGQARALALALTAEPIDAREAERIGLIWKAVPDAALREEAQRLADGFANGPTAALATIKRRIRAAAHCSFDEALDAERDAQGILGADETYKRAVMGFMRQRPRKAVQQADPLHQPIPSQTRVKP